MFIHFEVDEEKGKARLTSDMDEGMTYLWLQRIQVDLASWIDKKLNKCEDEEE
jgi:deferrochelatase/peroxidase EfeB